MPAYARTTVDDFLTLEPDGLIGQLETAYATDGYNTKFTQQTLAWHDLVPLLQRELKTLSQRRPESLKWAILIEFPLYRLRRRIDLVVLTSSHIVVIETKIGERRFRAEDDRQVEEYALDLRDFHGGSHDRQIIPVLWCTDASGSSSRFTPSAATVLNTLHIGKNGLAQLLADIPSDKAVRPLVGEEWDRSPYKPVPNVIQAATAMFSGHGVKAIAQADASNLRDAAARVVELITIAKREGHRVLVFLTGVPGSGKTLAGLNVVHETVETGAEDRGDIVYLSGNSPLVTVLREALARDEHARGKPEGNHKPLNEIRRKVKTRIQHINDFLKQCVVLEGPPHEHAIVFDEAQRAWDADQGQKKFNRDASEPALILEFMSRHTDWCACVCLVGGGQEINTGEQGVGGWGEAIRQLDPEIVSHWLIYAPSDVLQGGPSTGGVGIGSLPDDVLEALHEGLGIAGAA